MQIRSATFADATAISDFLTSHSNSNPAPEEIAAAIERSSHAAVAEIGGRVIGFARGAADGHSAGVLLVVIVHPEFRRQRIGTRLLEFLFDQSPSVLWLLRAPNGEAAAFFAGLGFCRSYIAMERQPSRGTQDA